MKILWFRCDVIIPSAAAAVLVVAVSLGSILAILDLGTSENFDKHCSMANEAENGMEEFRKSGRKAFVLGYTGEVGKALVEELARLRLYSKVYLLGRRTVPLDVGPEFEQKLVDFENLDEHKSLFEGVDTGFCCLGTTYAKSGKQGFIRVDHDYVLLSAEAAKAGGCRHFSLVSSQGANKNSSFLYPRTKGQVEDALKVMHFDRLTLYRPGVLMCDRVESRPSETVFRTLLKPLAHFFPTAITTPTKVVAMAMINNAVASANEKVELYENKAIHELSGISKGCESHMKRSASAPESSKTK